MTSLPQQLLAKIKGFQVPEPKNKTLQLILGIVNLIFFGIGTIIAGVISNDIANIVIGLLQLFIPFVGWVWSIVWGVIMILSSMKTTRTSPNI